MNFPEDVGLFVDQMQQYNNEMKTINFLDRAKAAEYARYLSDIETFSLLGLIPLEDSNNSNPLCYISKTVTSGMVMHLSHDGSSRLLFSDLDSLKQDLLRNLDAIECFPDFLDDLSCLTPQPLLDQEVRRILREEHEDSIEFCCTLYLPSTPLKDNKLVRKLIASDNLFVQESLFDAISQRPLASHIDVLEEVTRDFHPQVQPKYVRALSMAKQAKSGGRV